MGWIHELFSVQHDLRRKLFDLVITLHKVFNRYILISVIRDSYGIILRHLPQLYFNNASGASGQPKN